jgi:UDP-glucose 4-epimerase
MTDTEEVTEDAPLDIAKAKHVYTASKVAAELYCHAYQKLYGQNFTILRYGIPYGPRARGGTVVANFVKRALSGESLTIFGDGSQYRNFIYVEDLAEGNLAALDDKAVNQTYNLEGLRPITIKEIAETIKKLLGDIAIEYKESRPGDYDGARVLADKAKNELGWEPKVDFEEGVKRYVEWYKESISVNLSESALSR